MSDDRFSVEVFVYSIEFVVKCDKFDIVCEFYEYLDYEFIG